jgi:tRNA-Thr(GGU) m(6)t(6)A37 methyltransferase TsaA
MLLQKIGVVKNSNRKFLLVSSRDGIRLDGDIKLLKETVNGVSEILLYQKMTSFLDGIEDYSHIIVVYWGHKVPDEGREILKVHPAGLPDFPEQGIASTCSPARPNPVLITIVRLLKRKENRLLVEGLDAVNGSPVIDIKPYVNTMYPQKNVTVPEWMKRLLNDFNMEK